MEWENPLLSETVKAKNIQKKEIQDGQAKIDYFLRKNKFRLL